MIIDKILVCIGILLMMLSVFLCKKIISTIQRKEDRKPWSLLWFFICFFLAGYVTYLLLIAFWNVNIAVNNILVSAIFFFGALFVVLVLRTSLALLEKLTDVDRVLKSGNTELQKTTRQLRTKEAQLQQAQKELESKNDALKDTLEEFYTLRIGMEKDVKNRVFEAENRRIKKMLSLLKK